MKFHIEPDNKKFTYIKLEIEILSNKNPNIYVEIKGKINKQKMIKINEKLQDINKLVVDIFKKIKLQNKEGEPKE
jgi:hypothetical protein